MYMNSTNFEKDEQQIYDAFSHIEVDTDSLRQRVESIGYRKRRVPIKFSVAAAVIMIVIAISGTVYAATGGLEQLLARFDTNFGRMAVAPPEPVYAIDQGIRFEVIGAHRVDQTFLFYVAMQDISGENRLTETHGASIRIYADGRPTGGSHWHWLLELDHDTNTSLWEIRSAAAADTPLPDKLYLVVSDISGCIQQIRIRGDWRMTISISDVGTAAITWTDVQVGDYHIEYMTLNPFGLQFSGTRPFSRYFPRFSVDVVQGRRRIYLGGGGGSGGNESFDFHFFAEVPIDIEAVTAVIINGVRVSVP